jgi:hypothetical protein
MSKHQGNPSLPHNLNKFVPFDSIGLDESTFGDGVGNVAFFLKEERNSG